MHVGAVVSSRLLIVVRTATSPLRRAWTRPIRCWGGPARFRYTCIPGDIGADAVRRFGRIIGGRSGALFVVMDMVMILIVAGMIDRGCETSCSRDSSFASMTFSGFVVAQATTIVVRGLLGACSGRRSTPGHGVHEGLCRRDGGSTDARVE